MNILSDHNVPNSLRINSKCKYFVEVNEISEFKNLYSFINEQKKPIFILGEGTNIIPTDYFDGIVIKPKFNHIKFDNIKSTVSVGSSVNWHYFVEKMIGNNIYGYENLSLIPGSVGACPIQNIGAYGQDVSELILKIDCFDYKNNKLISLSNSECGFSYRNSSLRDKPYIIYNIDFDINRSKSLNLKYESIKNYIKNNKLDASKLSLIDTSKIIINIRNSILPDPKTIPNAGSFFKNPTINEQKINTNHFPLDDLIIWSHDDDKVKVGAARLIQLIKNDLNNYNNVSIYSKHALILISNGKASQKDILNFANNIKEVVMETFNISLDIEPTVIN
tara:strand:+ start:96 stop:1097 length:1002 start_codon:yes stop_codon:yes gene_type:complete